jgi:hypothetical protein
MRHSPHSNLYPVGTSPYQDPSCSSARAQGSKGGWDPSTERHVAASRRTGHTSHLGISKVVSVVSFRRF